MEIREKLDQGDENYLEIDLTESEIKGLSKGNFPCTNKVINGKRYAVSVGLKIGLQRGQK